MVDQPDAAGQVQAIQELLRQTLTQMQNRPILTPSAGQPLQSFTGEANDINWSEWEKQFSRVCTLAGATELDKKVALLSTYLRGRAQTLFNELERRDPPLTDWNAWAAQFLTTFPDNQQVDMKFEQLISRSHENGESVTQYAADIRRLAKRAIPAWNPQSPTDVLVKNHFVTRLQPNIRRWVQNAEPATFEDAVIQAQTGHTVLSADNP